MLHNEYYTIVAITLTSIIPVTYGIVFSLFNSRRRRALDNLSGISFSERQISEDVLKMIYIFILSFLSILLVIRLAEPVPAEGWLRTLFILVLFSSESVIVYSLIKLSNSGFTRILLLMLVLVSYVSIPLGLVLHNPWNYCTFISPFYWLAWAWIIPSPGESVAYAAIGMALSVLYLLLASRYLR